MSSINRVYLGLPENFRNIVLWVAREYRKNPLSHQPGGSDVIVEYHSMKIFGYDWIKFPSRYIQKVWLGNISEKHDDYVDFALDVQLDIIKEEIKSIYARKYTTANFEQVPFKQIWNSSTSIELPWKLLESYDHN